MSNKIERIELLMHSDKRGDLLAIEQNSDNIPFTPVRSFYLTRVPFSEKRAGHAVDSDLFILALRGSVTLIDFDSEDSFTKWELDKFNIGVLVPAFHYIELHEFSPDALVVVYASKKFEDTNYYSLDEIQNRK